MKSNVPKQPMNAYFTFGAEMRQQKKVKGSVSEEVEEIAELWNSLPATEREDRTDKQKRLIKEWKLLYGNKEESARKETVPDGGLAFKLFCLEAIKEYEKKKQKQLAYSLMTRNELENQFSRVKSQFEEVAAEISLNNVLKKEIEKDFNSWVD